MPSKGKHGESGGGGQEGTIGEEIKDDGKELQPCYTHYSIVCMVVVWETYVTLTSGLGQFSWCPFVIDQVGDVHAI